MASFIDRASALAATAGEIARLKGSEHEAQVLAQAKASLIVTGHDNWENGTDIHSLLLEIGIPLYAAVDEHKERIEKAILDRVRQLIRTESGNAISDVVISPVFVDGPRSPSDGGTALAVESESEAIPSFWEPGHFRLFISHAVEKKENAHLLKDALARFQIAAFVAHDDIAPTKEWQAEIEAALRTMDALAAMVSPAFLGSKWCDQEVGVALGRSKFVVPLMLGADPHGFMGKLQGLQTKGLTAAAIGEQMAEIFIKHDQTSQRMTEALVERLVRSKNWDSSKRTIGLLEKASHLNTSQAGRLLDSIEGNSEVKDAFGVPERIRALVAKNGATKSL